MRFGILVFAGICWAQKFSPQDMGVLDAISADDLKANLSFLSSDLLEGRDTPSRGLDIAGEFIASQFRRAGLEPQFQNAEFETITPDMTGFSLTVNGTAVTEKVTISVSAAVDIKDAPAYLVENSTPPSLEGKVAVLPIPDFTGQAARENIATYQRSLAATQARHPLAIIQYNEGTARGGGRGGGARPRLIEVEAAKAAPPVVTIGDSAAAKLFEHKATVSIHANAPVVLPAHLRNVAAIMKGSDPELSKTYILVTAHYDHIGMKATGRWGPDFQRRERRRVGHGVGDRGGECAGDDESAAEAIDSVHDVLRRRERFVGVAILRFASAGAVEGYCCADQS